MVCLENVLKISLQEVLKTSWRHMAKTNIMVLTKTSWRRKAKANIFVLIKTSWRRFEDVFWRRRWKTSSRRLHQDECLLGSDCFATSTAILKNEFRQLDSSSSQQNSCFVWLKFLKVSWSDDTRIACVILLRCSYDLQRIT